ncbi:hypothetical protein CsSME_00033727 [Camellia sinensis var. sinensis]
MVKCISLTTLQDWLYRYSFGNAGLQSSTTDLGDGTLIHFWHPKSHKPNQPTLLLIHDIGATAMWQWNEFISFGDSYTSRPALVFFGDSYTSRPDRTESFQAQCVMRAMEAHGVRRRIHRFSLFFQVTSDSPLSDLPTTSRAKGNPPQWPDAVERVVIVAAGVCMEEMDVDEGLFTVRSVDESTAIYLL